MPPFGRQKPNFDQDMPWMQSSTPEASLAWAQEAYNKWAQEGKQGPVPFNTNVFQVKDGKIGFTKEFDPSFDWKDAWPVLAVAGGMGIGALLGGGAAAGSGAAASAAPGATGGAATAGGLGGGLAATPGVTAGIPAGSTVGATVGSVAGPLGAAPLTPLARNIAAPLANAVLGGGSKGGWGSLISKFLNPDTLKDLGRGVSALGQTQASNRGTELDAMMEADKMRILQDRERSQDESDIWRRLQAIDYVKRGGAGQREPQISASGRKIPTFNFGPAPISEGNKQMAATLEEQLLKRLNNPPQLRDYDSKMKQGLGERASNWLGPALYMGSNFFGKD